MQFGVKALAIIEMYFLQGGHYSNEIKEIKNIID